MVTVQQNFGFAPANLAHASASARPDPDPDRWLCGTGQQAILSPHGSSIHTSNEFLTLTAWVGSRDVIQDLIFDAHLNFQVNSGPTVAADAGQGQGRVRVRVRVRVSVRVRVTALRVRREGQVLST